jgi:hypothetical protein
VFLEDGGLVRENLMGVIFITPRIKKGGRGGVTSISPNPDILNTPAGYKGEIIHNAIESTGVPPLPDAPGNGSIDSGLFKHATLCELEVVKLA